MISYLHVLEAVNVANGWQPLKNVTSHLVKQLASSLDIYKGRGEFDGTMSSARDCLVMAEYDLSNYDRELTDAQAEGRHASP